MPHYPSGYYGINTGNTYNNVVTRRLAVKDRVNFAQSSRFGGQWLEPKGTQAPYNGTIMEAVGAVQQLVNEVSQCAQILPDLGNTVILSTVGVATNVLQNNVGVAVSFVGAVAGTIGTTMSIDGVGFSTGLRVLFYGLATASLNGVYVVGYSAPNVLAQGVTTLAIPTLVLNRAPDLANWWQFVKPKVFVAQGGTTNRGQMYALTTDGWENNPFNVALGTSLTSLAGSSINFSSIIYTPGVNTSTTSLIYPPYNVALNQNAGEYDFLAQNSIPKFIHLKNRARRMAYQIFKMRENYTPSVSVYQNNVPYPIGAGNTLHNIGVGTLNDLSSGSRYPSGFNRGF